MELLFDTLYFCMLAVAVGFFCVLFAIGTKCKNIQNALKEAFQEAKRGRS